MGLYEAFKTKYTEEEIEDLLEILENRINILENTEQRIGTYNGKPLYRYIHVPTNYIPVTGKGWVYNQNWGLPPHIETVVNMHCYYGNGPSTKMLVSVRPDTSRVNYYQNPAENYAVNCIYLEYTKTTD